MVIGNGMLANEFKSYEGADAFVVFASGVSDSTHAPAEAFERERKLLQSTIEENNEKTLVYFSTCSIYDKSLQHSSYVIHKQKMEELISENQPAYIIFRLSNPIGKTSNTNTVVNFFIKHIREKEPFQVWKNATRNIIDIDHLYIVCNEILQKNMFTNSIINIANPDNYSVPFVVETIEAAFFNERSLYISRQRRRPHIDTSVIEPLFKKFNIIFEQDYLSKLLQKYFPQQ